MHMPNSLSPKAISNEKGERQSNFTKTNPKETLSVIFFTSTTSESSFSRFPPDARKSFPGALLDGIVRCRPNFAFNAPLFYNRFRQFFDTKRATASTVSAFRLSLLQIFSPLFVLIYFDAFIGIDCSNIQLLFSKFITKCFLMKFVKTNLYENLKSG